MKGKKHTPDQVIAKLAEGDRMLNEGKTIAEVARSFGITETTWHRWKNTYGGMKANDAKRLKELEAENRRLKIMVADLTLDKAMLKDEGSRETSNPEPQAQRCEVVAPAVRGLKREEPAGSPVNQDLPRGRSQSPKRTSTPRSSRSCASSPSPILAKAIARPIGQC